VNARGEDLVKKAIYIFVTVSMLIACYSLNAAASNYEITFTGQIDHDLFSVSQSGAFAVSKGRKLTLFDMSGEKILDTIVPFQVKAITFGPEGSLFVAYGTILAKFDADGGKAWESEANEEIVAITILPDGNPAVGHSYGIQAFNDDGKSIWEYYPHEECDY
jgi:hypothetical protein